MGITALTHPTDLMVTGEISPLQVHPRVSQVAPLSEQLCQGGGDHRGHGQGEREDSLQEDRGRACYTLWPPVHISMGFTGTCSPRDRVKTTFSLSEKFSNSDSDSQTQRATHKAEWKSESEAPFLVEPPERDCRRMENGSLIAPLIMLQM